MYSSVLFILLIVHRWYVADVPKFVNCQQAWIN